MNALYRMRDWVGIPPALLVFLLLIAVPARHLIGRFTAGPFEINIAAPDPLPSPSKPELAPSPERPPLSLPAPKAATSPRIRDSVSPVASALPAPSSAASASPPHKEVLEPSESALSAVPARTPSPVTSPAPTVPAAAMQEANNISVEAAYIAQIRSDVQSRKKYPTGREASVQKPSGTVRACMDVSRAGVAADDIIIERTSHSMILDAEARKLLRTGAYPPFPAGAFPGESTHRFCIHLDYLFQASG